MKQCSDKRCHAPKVTCRLGESTPADCPVWRNGAEVEGASANVESDGATTLLPWSGSALGTGDLSFLTGRGEAKLIALLGAHNAGKTTLLAAWYQRLGRSGMVGNHRFSGSFSLEGWEAVGHALRWEGEAPTFPPHTSSGTGRAPGMLHLAVRDERNRLSDFLFADSPGEWFERWAVDKDASDAEGARWLVERASALIVVADCEALSGNDRGKARNEFIQLLRRAASERDGRPVALVWSKADVQITEGMRTTIREAAFQAIPELIEFPASIANFMVGSRKVDAEIALTDILAWTLEPRKRGFDLPVSPTMSKDPFFNFGLMP